MTKDDDHPKIGYLRFGEPCKHTDEMLKPLIMVNHKTDKRKPVKDMYQCQCGAIIKREGVKLGKN